MRFRAASTLDSCDDFLNQTLPPAISKTKPSPAAISSCDSLNSFSYSSSSPLLQGSVWPLSFLMNYCTILRNRLLADPSFLCTVGTELVTLNMLQFMKELGKAVTIGVVGGSDLVKISEQLGQTDDYEEF